MTNKYFSKYTRIEAKEFIDTLFQYMTSVKKSITERTRHQRQYDRRVNKRQMQTQESKVDMSKALDVGFVVTKRSGIETKKHDTSSKSGNDTHVEDADSELVNDKEPMAEVHFPAEHNVLANEQQHVEQPEFNNEGRVDQDAEQCQVKSPLLKPSPDNKKTKFSNQSLESKNISLKKIVAQLQKDFSRMEAHCFKKI
ncbi:hypothetical protein Tco_0640016 [Tanacetum coccineum]